MIDYATFSFGPPPGFDSSVQFYSNGVAGIHIMGESTNFTFDATIGPDSTSGEGNVGSKNGQQPIEVIIEGSTLVTFNDLRVQSSNGEYLPGFFL